MAPWLEARRDNALEIAHRKDMQAKISEQGKLIAALAKTVGSLTESVKKLEARSVKAEKPGGAAQVPKVTLPPVPSGPKVPFADDPNVSIKTLKTNVYYCTKRWTEAGYRQ